MKDESTKDVQMNSCSDVTSSNPLLRWKCETSTERQREISRAGGIKSGQVRAEKKRRLETLKAATTEYLKENAEEIVSSIGTIAKDKSTPSLQIKAAGLLADMSGELQKQADVSINIDLCSMSDAELQTIIDSDAE